MFTKVSVIGQGYVGLPLSMHLAKIGIKVNGIDTNQGIVDTLNRGISSIEDVSSTDVLMAKNSGLYEATSSFEKISESNVVIICVPTPLNGDHLPDLSYLNLALTELSKYVKPGSLIILESTVAPGTTRNLVVKTIESGTSSSIDNFYLVFSPERIDPRNKMWNISNTPKLVAGLTEKCCKLGFQFYSMFIDNVVKCSSLEVAETAKLLENSFRLVNISFINELSIFCEKLGVDVNDVVRAAATKPYGYMPFYPSIGVGGHCIPVDPIYLSSRAKELGVPTKFIDLATQINNETPSYFVEKAREKLGELNNKNVLIIGVAYKPNVADVRETAAFELIKGLKEGGANVYWHDDLVREWNSEKSVEISSNYDLAIIAAQHDYIELSKLGEVPLIRAGEKIR
jgi:UDP-N-acetyl-D-glucosamine dehydrogenase